MQLFWMLILNTQYPKQLSGTSLVPKPSRYAAIKSPFCNNFTQHNKIFQKERRYSLPSYS